MECTGFPGRIPLNHIVSGAGRQWKYAVAENRGYGWDGRPGSSLPGVLIARGRSHAAIIRFEKGILGITRFLASLRNDRGGGIMAFALPGTVRFLASLRNDSGGGIMAFALTGMTRFRPSCTVASTYPRCHLDRRERSHAAIIRFEKGILSRQHEISRFASK